MKTHRTSFYLPLILSGAIVTFSLGCNLAKGLQLAAPQAAAVATPARATPTVPPTATPIRTLSPQPPTATSTVPATATPTTPATATPTWTPLPQPPTVVPTVLPTAAPASSSKEKAPAFIVFDSMWTSEDATSRKGIYRVNPDGTDLALLVPFLRRGDWSVAVSPDGQKMLYSGGDGDIYLANVDGSDLTNLTQTPDRDEGRAVWSPDGQRIWYGQYNYSPDADSADICVMNADGSHPMNLTNNQPGYYSVARAWSPDGQRILFGTSSPDQQQDIYVMNVDGTNRTNLTNTPDRSEIGSAWSPDRRQIAYYSEDENVGWDLFIANADGTAPAHLALALPEHYSISYFAEFTWSPDGQRVAFLADSQIVNDNEFPKPSITSLFVANVDGSNATRLTDPSLNVRAYSWSPDGQRLAYAGFPSDALTGEDNHALYVVNADGSGTKRLTEADFADIDAIEWVSP
jgi:Tol biopolymer transport system component